jgi:undecaprenyl diphosphate synthase
LNEEVSRLHENGIRFRVIGDLSRFDAKLVELIRGAETLTENNTALTLTIAANYGGRWDILQAIEKMLEANPGKRTGFTETDLAAHLSLNFGPEPDLFIRTGGEERISNFLLWQLAYSELYFTDTLWPEFNAAALDEAIASYQQRERRFGRTSEQLGATAEDGPGDARRQAGVADALASSQLKQDA